MKTVVSVNEISEFEIKPKDLLVEWKQMVNAEMARCWGSKNEWVTVACPICKTKEATHAFVKQDFTYVECNHCKTLYAATRPSTKELNSWYTVSESVQFWQNTLLKSSEASRESKIIEPRVNWILDGLSEYFPNLRYEKIRCTDISFFGKALLDKIADSAKGIHLTAAGITAINEKYDPEKINVQAIASIDDMSSLKPTDVLVAIDVLERVSSISDLFLQLQAIVNPGGLVFATCPVSSGFEIQSLWDKSPTISLPDKLNLPSVKGLIEHISSTSKWEILELSTPGMFDVELVRRVMLQMPDAGWPRTLHALLDTIDQPGMERFTEYLQSQRLSSFARIVLRRKQN